MTHSGGKPHAVGDRGQRYEVSFFNPATNERQVLGWTDDLDAARRMADGVDQHPAWEFPWVTDREAGVPDRGPKVSMPPAHEDGCALRRDGLLCTCRLSKQQLPRGGDAE